MTDDAERDALAAWVREYSDAFGHAFHAGDPALMRPYCHVPALAIGGGAVRLIATEAESDARWAAAHAGLPGDYDHSVLHTVDVTFTGADAAFVTVNCGRYTRAGEEYVNFDASYVVARTDDGWRITAWIGHR